MINNFNNHSKKIAYIYRNIGPYLGLGTQLALTIILMFFLGKWLDDFFNTSPILMLIFSFLGCFAAVFNFVKTVINLNKKNKYNGKTN